MKQPRWLMARAATAIVATLLLVAPGTAQANPSGGPGASPGGVKTLPDDVAKPAGVKQLAAAEYFTQAPRPWWCPYGAVCFYSQLNGVGQVCYSYGDVWDSGCGVRQSYFNNGAPCSGCDHVYAFNGTHMAVCLHYGWAEGRGNFPPQWPSGFNVRYYVWGGECQ